jgi:hypothetical protein
MVEGVRFSEDVSMLSDLVVDLTISDGGKGDHSFLGCDKVNPGGSPDTVRIDASSGQLRGTGA